MVARFLDIAEQECLKCFKDTIIQPICALGMTKVFHWPAWSAYILNSLQSILLVLYLLLSPQEEKRVDQLLKILPQDPRKSDMMELCQTIEKPILKCLLLYLRSKLNQKCHQAVSEAIACNVHCGPTEYFCPFCFLLPAPITILHTAARANSKIKIRLYNPWLKHSKVSSST